MDTTNRIVELALLIANKTFMINNFLVEKGLPTLSLDADAPRFPPIPDRDNMEYTRNCVIEACTELRALMTGPRDLLRFNWTSHSSAKVILHFKLDKSFPVGESTSFKAMSKFSGLSEKNVQRVIRHAITHHYLFQEKTSGVITHSSLTAILSRDDAARNSLIVELDEIWPAAVKMADALEKWPDSEECNETAFNLVNNTNKSMYEILAEDPIRRERFEHYLSQPDISDDNVFFEIPWEDRSTMVQVGGSYHKIAIGVAQQFPNMKCFVQDLPDAIARAESQFPADLRDGVTFMVHDFINTPQPLSVDIYIFRSTMDNLADNDCIKILRNLIPALKKGATIIVYERISPDLPRSGYHTEYSRRDTNFDMGMAQLLNKPQRTWDMWHTLFNQIDSRFEYICATRPNGSMYSFVEFVWDR
ncbi:S-adenosyl-L-methionine-dependent methyltransferase [Annulohypoxylon maeteangense]|uniref:S-adenosyl-L-methionine-dependent methyltransferase n=1 Tax=Annulohypoxylon maeteangense TaxID=1927788 RepID=UPI002008E037|nr:S-adenosyl-L-methionine-dependent methyltransferase [Annulohypoxylon maeteangense]KAI0881270.1 S-adenosyl-L-methionine-dependent methyltransferase [Annulohypoxylon maeteangense]